MIELLFSTRERSAMSGDISVVTTGVLLLASSGESPGMLLVIQQSSRGPRNREVPGPVCSHQG